MYKYILILISSVVLISCSDKGGKNSVSVEVPLTSDGKVDTSKLPKFSFVNETFDFGKIQQGEKVSYSFRFTNTGSTPLLITSANATCGCTVPSYPEQPIQPGQEGKIDVVFDSEGKSGMQTKTVTIIANTIPNSKVLYLRGEILE